MSESEIKIETRLTTLEARFFDQPLLHTEYLSKLRRAYEDTAGTCFYNPFRSYTRLLTLLESVRNYDSQHAKAFVKRFRDEARSFKSCEAIFAEVIVYSAYIPLIAEGTIKRIHLEANEGDVQLERVDGSRYFLEVLSIMPDFTPDNDGLIDVKTHLHHALSSVRQKLLYKIHKQKQLSKERENWAVIELNAQTIAGDFSVLASLSDGYKVWLDRKTGKIVSSGFDWTRSFFDDVATRNLKGVMWFSLGDFESRKSLQNPYFRRGSANPALADDLRSGTDSPTPSADMHS